MSTPITTETGLTRQKVQSILRRAGFARSRYERIGRRNERIPGYEAREAEGGMIRVEFRAPWDWPEQGDLARYRAALEAAGLVVVERDGWLEVSR